MSEATQSSNEIFLCDYEQCIDLSIEMSRCILRPIGVWPQVPHVSRIEKLSFLGIHILCYALIGFLLIPCGLFVVLEVKDPYVRFRITGPLNFCLMAMLKYSSLNLRNREIRQCIECIESDWKTVGSLSDQTIMIENALFGRKLIKICGVFMYGGALFYGFLAPLIRGKITAEDGNFTYLPLVYPVAKVLLDARVSPVNEIFFGIQCLSGLLAHTITIGGCSLAAVFSMHAYGQLELVMCWLGQLTDMKQNSVESVGKRMEAIVSKHVKTLGFISVMGKVLNEVSFFEIVSSTSGMCLLGYYILMEWEDSRWADELTYFILLISIGFNIFIYCYIGQLLFDQCKKVGDASYMIDWYRLSWKESLGLILISARSNYSTKITAGHMFELCLRFFGDIIKTSVAYLNLLRALAS